MIRVGLAWAGVLVLLALHLDFWRPQAASLWFGWIPGELGWRLLWMAAAWAYLAFFTRSVWREVGSTGLDGSTNSGAER